MKKIWCGMMTVLAMGLLLSGCGKDTEQQAESDSYTETAEDTDLVQMFVAAEDDEDVPTIMSEFAEETEYPELAIFLSEYYQIPAETQTETRYYYNYIDINEDGTDEIFAIVIGEYTEQDNGDPALLLTAEADGSFAVIKSFDGVHTPILISEELTNGWHDIIYQVYGRDTDDGYLSWYYDLEKGYDAESTELLESIPSVSGIEILSNNLIDDMDKGRYMTLAPGENRVE